MPIDLHSPPRSRHASVSVRDFVARMPATARGDYTKIIIAAGPFGSDKASGVEEGLAFGKLVEPAVDGAL